MKYYKDSGDGFYAYPDNASIAGLTEITEAAFLASAVPPTLAQAQTSQIQTLAKAYQTAIAQPVTYTSKGGVTKLYQADPQSIANLSQMMLAFVGTQILPIGFYWVCADNTKVPFVYADLQGLAAAMGAQGFAAFDTLQTKKAQVLAAADVVTVQAIK